MAIDIKDQQLDVTNACHNGVHRHGQLFGSIAQDREPCAMASPALALNARAEEFPPLKIKIPF